MRLGLANCDGPKTRANEPWEGNLSAENSGSAVKMSSNVTTNAGRMTAVAGTDADDEDVVWTNPWIAEFQEREKS
jgi:hypothetical protein